MPEFRIADVLRTWLLLALPVVLLSAPGTAWGQQETAETTADAWDLGVLMAGQVYPTTVSATNIDCPGRQDLEVGVEGEIADLLRVPQPRIREVAPQQTKTTRALVDLTEAAPGVYRGTLHTRCLTCGACAMDAPVIEVAVRVEAGRSAEQELLADLTSTDADLRTAAAEEVLTGGPEAIAARVERLGADAVLRLFVVAASSGDDAVRKIAGREVGRLVAAQEEGTLEPPVREVAQDLAFLLLESGAGLFAKELIEPGSFRLTTSEKCRGAALARCLRLQARIAGVADQIELRADADGVVAAAGSGVYLIDGQALDEQLEYRYDVEPETMRDGRVAVSISLANPGGTAEIKGCPLTVFAEPFLLELIRGGALAALWRPAKPKPGTTCCYYVRLVGLGPSCPRCAITRRGPWASCPNNLRTCKPKTADSSLCLTKTVAGTTCPALTAAEQRTCKQATGCP